MEVTLTDFEVNVIAANQNAIMQSQADIAKLQQMTNTLVMAAWVRAGGKQSDSIYLRPDGKIVLAEKQEVN